MSFSRIAVYGMTSGNFVENHAKSKFGNGYKKLPKQELIDLVIKAKTDPKAMERVLVAVFPLLMQKVRGHSYNGLHSNTNDDLFQTAFFGLKKAVDNYDPEILNDEGQSMSFTTYLTHWVDQSIRREMGNTEHLVRMPIHVLSILSSIKRGVKNHYRQIGKEEPRSLKHLDIKFLRQFLSESNQKFGDDTIMNALSWMDSCETMISLDMTSFDDSDETLGSNIAAPQDSGSFYQSVEDSMGHEQKADGLGKLVYSLKPRLRMVIMYRFGLNGFPEMTLDEVGKKLGVTRERIRQIETLALRTIKGRVSSMRNNGKLKYDSIQTDRKSIEFFDSLNKILTNEEIQRLLTRDEYKFYQTLTKQKETEE